MSERTVEFFFDYGSPYSYLADTQLEGLRERTGARVVYRPMLLGGVFKATGNRSPAEEPVEAKRRYGRLELERWVAQYGVPFQANPFFPINTLALMRACVGAQREDLFESFHRLVYPAFWAQGLNLGDPKVLGRVLDGAGLPAGRLLELASDAGVKRELRATTEEAVERGVFGAPSFFVGEQLYWGTDRLMWVEAALGAKSNR
jgi:2-hydroxychromene-2-carboxylate isomerase